MIYDLADSLKWCGWVSYCSSLSVSSIQLGDPLGLPIDLGRGGKGIRFSLRLRQQRRLGWGERPWQMSSLQGCSQAVLGWGGVTCSLTRPGGLPAPLWALLPPRAGTGLLPGLAGYQSPLQPHGAAWPAAFAAAQRCALAASGQARWWCHLFSPREVLHHEPGSKKHQFSSNSTSPSLVKQRRGKSPRRQSS